MTVLTWSDDRVEQLKKLWESGLSASQIAAELGNVTRNAVIGMQSLLDVNEQTNWRELVVEDRHATPAEVASFKLDFADWLKRLKRSKRKVALRLAAGDTTSEVASHFRLSRGRISQLRNELQQDWGRQETYQGVIDIMKAHTMFGTQIFFSKWALGGHEAA